MQINPVVRDRTTLYRLAGRPKKKTQTSDEKLRRVVKGVALVELLCDLARITLKAFFIIIYYYYYIDVKFLNSVFTGTVTIKFNKIITFKFSQN